LLFVKLARPANDALAHAALAAAMPTRAQPAATATFSFVCNGIYQRGFF
jgi:hypothetical protein